MNRRGFLARAGAVMAGAAGWLEGRPISALEQPNEAIQQAREAALKVLKPTSRELEYGLKLHADALVFDTYGFAPRAAVDGETLGKAVEAGASEAELQDLREEMSMTRCATDPAERAEFEQAWKAAGVTCIFQNAGEEGQDPLRLLKRLARFTYVTDMLRDFVRRAATPEDILTAKKEGRHCLYLTGNGVPLAQQWVSVEEELRYIRVFFQLGIRMMHLTYNRRNVLGDGCAEPANGGLSDLGRAAIAEMNRVGVIVDVAHSGWQTSLEAAKASARPVVASHTGCAAVHRHIRCKPDEVLRAIADTEGLVGSCCIPSFLGGGITALLDHIDYIVRKFGVDYVGIGTDVAYSSRAVAREEKRVPPRHRTRTRYEALWPKDALVPLPRHQLSLAWTNWPLFTVGLVQRGYPEKDIRKILGDNMLRVARAALGSQRKATGGP
ncbi:MAG: dipeptidase [Gemmataceae bacterium]|nr:dipeptidase [Gemmataceae bacterium]